MILGLASMLVAMSTSTAVDIAIDLLQNATDPVEDGYTGFLVGNKSAGSVAPTITVGDVTATIAVGNKIASLTDTAEFTGWNARNRSPFIPDSGSFTHAQLYANRIASLTDTPGGAATGTGIGIYVRLDGLQANKAYVIQASGNDPNATPALKKGSFYLWDATNEVTDGSGTSGLVAIDSYSVPDSLPTTIADNDVYSASGEITTDGSGSLIFKVTGTIDKNTLNGFSATLVPDAINPPTNLVATTDGAKVDLDWSDDLSGTLAFYSVYRGEAEGGPYTPVAPNVPTSAYSDTTVATGTTYYYVVTATDVGAFETANSDEVSMLVRIQPPTGLTRTQGDGVIDLDWNDNTSGILDFYTVYRSETPGGPYDTPLATNLTTSDYSDTTVINGTTYYYVVTATDDVVALESTNSAQVSGTPFTPVAGTALYAHLDGSVTTSVTADENSIVSLWADQTAGGFDATSTGGVGTVFYPASVQSATGLDALDFGLTDTSLKSTLAWFSPVQQDAWLNFNDGNAAAPYSGFAVFAVVRPNAILGGSIRDVVLSSIESKFALRYEAGRPRMLLGTSVLLGTAGAVAAAETVVLAVNYNTATGDLELWDSESGLTATATVPAGDFSHTTALFLGGSANPDQRMEGFIGEAKIYRGSMTPSEFAAEQTALVTKWIGAPAGGFSAWQLANSTEGGLNDDHDNDGVDNGVEFFLGGTSDTTGFTPLPGVVNTSGTLSVTWTKATSYGGTYGTDFWVETSATLSPPWTEEAEGGNVTITVDEVNGDKVKYTFPAGTKNFARLKVTGP
jgi:hypothetical protein